MEKALLEKAVSLAPLILKVHMSHESFDFLFFFLEFCRFCQKTYWFFISPLSNDDFISPIWAPPAQVLGHMYKWESIT